MQNTWRLAKRWWPFTKWCFSKAASPISPSSPSVFCLDCLSWSDGRKIRTEPPGSHFSSCHTFAILDMKEAPLQLNPDWIYSVCNVETYWIHDWNSLSTPINLLDVHGDLAPDWRLSHRPPSNMGSQGWWDKPQRDSMKKTMKKLKTNGMAAITNLINLDKLQ